MKREDIGYPLVLLACLLFLAATIIDSRASGGAAPPQETPSPPAPSPQVQSVTITFATDPDKFAGLTSVSGTYDQGQHLTNPHAAAMFTFRVTRRDGGAATQNGMPSLSQIHGKNIVGLSEAEAQAAAPLLYRASMLLLHQTSVRSGG